MKTAPFFTKLKYKLIFFTFIVELVMLTLLIFNSVNIIQKHLVSQAEKQLEELKYSLHTSLAVPLISRDYGSVKSVIDEFTASNKIEYIVIYKDKKAMMASNYDVSSPLPQLSQHFSTDESVYHAMTQVIYQGENYADIFFGINTSFLKYASNELFLESILIAATEIILSLALLIAIGVWLTKNLETLTHAVKDISSGNFDINLKIKTEDEIGVLIQSFNQMSRQIKKQLFTIQQSNQQLSYNAHHDLLTGLWNRYAFENKLNEILQDIQKADSFQHALLYLDLDQFKLINDTCGHNVGDSVLQKLTKELLQITKNGYLARLGGDEFGLIVPYDIHDAYQKALKILETIGQKNFIFNNKTFKLGASIGIVGINQFENLSANNLLMMADTACYVAKEKGRNRVEIYLSDDKYFKEQKEQFDSVSIIHDALQDNRFILYVQTIKSLNPSLPDHCEILLRLKDTDGKIIAPSTFIPAAERFNLITKIDKWVVENTFQYLSENQELTCKHISINLSGLTLSEADFIDFVFSMFHHYKINPQYIGFEITETSAVADIVHAKHFIDSMRQFGVSIYLDDFGAGFSSFAYLQDLNADFLKIDGLFIKDLITNPKNLSIVKSMIEIAKINGMKTVAEYVSTEDIYTIIQTLDIDFVQGYAIDEPHPWHIN